MLPECFVKRHHANVVTRDCPGAAQPAVFAAGLTLAIDLEATQVLDGHLSCAEVSERNLPVPAFGLHRGWASF